MSPGVVSYFIPFIYLPSFKVIVISSLGRDFKASSYYLNKESNI